MPITNCQIKIANCQLLNDQNNISILIRVWLHRTPFLLGFISTLLVDSLIHLLNSQLWIVNKIYLFLSKYQFYNGLDFKLKLSIALERNKYSFVNAKFNAENSLSLQYQVCLAHSFLSREFQTQNQQLLCEIYISNFSFQRKILT